ncbi:MAG TPA: hypothetical protein VF698_08345, partial [Thermoanaerobaculia bacterium]
GTNASQFTIKPVTTRSFWVRITGTCGTKDSSVAQLSVYPSITADPAQAAICNLGESPTFSVTASGSGLTYQWFRKYSGGTWQQVGNDTRTSPIQIDQLPVLVYCAVTSGAATRNSSSADVVQNPKPTLTSISITTLSTGYYRLSSNMPDDERSLVTYAWYEGALGDTSTPKQSGTSYPLIQVSPTTRPRTYWLRVSFLDTGCYVDKAVTIQ